MGGKAAARIFAQAISQRSISAFERSGASGNICVDAGCNAAYPGLRMKKPVSFLVSLPQKTLMSIVKAYRLLLSPSLGSACRFEPSCSAYSLEALDRHGAATGSYLTLRRLARCHPWCDGGLDPVPQKTAPKADKTSIFSRLVTPVTSLSTKKNLS